jgi:hypothetical protein
MNMHPPAVFRPREKGHAMTAAERQQRCRANGKGRHRGRRTATKAEKARYRAEFAAMVAAAQAEEDALMAAAAGGTVQMEASAASHSPPATTPLPDAAIVPLPEWNLSAMAA